MGWTTGANCGHRLEHLEMITAEQAAELAGWGVMASMQPSFDALWGGRDGRSSRRLGADRAGRLNPFALLASQGVALAFGSDAPVTGLDLWGTVRAAANHQTPGSAISSRAAFAAASRGGWQVW
jgi:predicted amidohydrolase YtcJ